MGFVKRPGLTRDSETYPHLFTMPIGKVLMAGPGRFDTALYDFNTGQWNYGLGPGGNRLRTNLTRIGGNAILLPDGPAGSSKVMQIGGWQQPDPPVGISPATATTETIDRLADASSQWITPIPWRGFGGRAARTSAPRPAISSLPALGSWVSVVTNSLRTEDLGRLR